MWQYYNKIQNFPHVIKLDINYKGLDNRKYIKFMNSWIDFLTAQLLAISTTDNVTVMQRVWAAPKKSSSELKS